MSRGLGDVYKRQGAEPDVQAAAGEARPDRPLLRETLARLAHEDPAAGARVLTGLLPALGLAIEGPLDLDLVLAEGGVLAVSVEDGATTVRPLDRPRSRRGADARLSAAAAPLADLLAGHGPAPRRFTGPLRLTGRRRDRARAALAALPGGAPGLAAAVAAGARVEPADVWRLLALAVDPAWTRGHAFTVAQEVTGEGGGTWYLTASDDGLAAGGTPPPEGEPAAAVTLSRAALDAMLRGEDAPAGERPRVRGDRAAVALLKEWMDRVRGAAAA